MTRRKLPGESWDGHIEQMIRRAEEEGAFRNLPGMGKPIPNLNEPYDPDWWLKQLMEREDLHLEPDTLRVRREVELGLARIRRLGTESSVRRTVAELNAKIIEVNRTVTTGPGSDLAPLDADEVVRRWRQARGA